MLFTNDEGSSFEMNIRGYQFPEVEDDKYDSNWLIVKINVNHPKGHWVSQYPCLLTWEVEDLAEWLSEIAYGRPAKSVLNFIEPNLEFYLENDKYTQILRVYFETEFRPDWAPWDEGIMQDLWLDFPLVKLDLDAAVQSLHNQRLKYPPRAVQ
jgi:hypothetical protein